jgi:glycosyltransferase involved in cell wall biosynthesis
MTEPTLPRVGIFAPESPYHAPALVQYAWQVIGSLQQYGAGQVETQVLSPHWWHLLGRMPWSVGQMCDEVINRLGNHPDYLRRRLRRRCDSYHFCDARDAHLTAELPPGRVVVCCHDLHPFTSVLQRGGNPLRQALVRQQLEGLRRAAVVLYSTETLRRKILIHELLDDARLVYCPPGVAEVFRQSAPPAENLLPRVRQWLAGGPYLLQVGGQYSLAEFRITLALLAHLRQQGWPGRLLWIGPPPTPACAVEAERLGVWSYVSHLENPTEVDRAGLYHGAGLVVVPQSEDTFTPTLAEALACGSKVLARALPALVEIGGDMATYLPEDDLAAWCAVGGDLLQRQEVYGERAQRMRRVANFDWAIHAQIIMQVHARLRQ